MNGYTLDNFSIFLFSLIIQYMAIEFIYHMLSELCTENRIVENFLDFYGFHYQKSW